MHIAKTGGMSLRRLLRTTRVVNSFDCLHHNYLLRFRDGRQVERLPFDPSALSRYDVAVLTLRHPRNDFAAVIAIFWLVVLTEEEKVTSQRMPRFGSRTRPNPGPVLPCSP